MKQARTTWDLIVDAELPMPIECRGGKVWLATVFVAGDALRVHAVRPAPGTDRAISETFTEAQFAERFA